MLFRSRDRRDVHEVLPADVGRQHDQGSGLGIERVAEAVHFTRWRVHHTADAEVARGRADRVAQRAGQHVHDLLAPGMTVWWWHVRVRGNGEFEHADAARRDAVVQVADGELADAEGICLHAVDAKIGRAHV